MTSKATAFFDEALRIDPQESNVYYRRALSNIALGKDADAAQDAEKAIELGFDSDVLKQSIDALRTQT